jgi:hypothetical protein
MRDTDQPMVPFIMKEEYDVLTKNHPAKSFYKALYKSTWSALQSEANLSQNDTIPRSDTLEMICKQSLNTVLNGWKLVSRSFVVNTQTWSEEDKQPQMSVEEVKSVIENGLFANPMGHHNFSVLIIPIICLFDFFSYHDITLTQEY